jgi:hypothetical protein
LNATADAVEQRDAQVRFQSSDLPGGCRLTQVKAGSRTRDASRIGNGNEGAQLAEVHPSI